VTSGHSAAPRCPQGERKEKTNTKRKIHGSQKKDETGENETFPSRCLPIEK